MAEPTKMPSIRSVLQNMRLPPENRPSPLPEEAFCTCCGKISPSWLGLPHALEERGLTLFDAMPAICECARLSEERFQRRLVAANIPGSETPRTFENFTVVVGAEGGLEATRQWVAGGGPAVLTLVGGTGSGKSHLLEAAGRMLVAEGHSCRFEESSAMLQNMRPPSDGREPDRDWPAYYQGVPALLVDDLGVEKPTIWAIERLTAIISPRLRDQRRTMITTNLPRAMMLKHLGIEDPVGARRLVSRLFGEETDEARVVVLTCPDYRTGKVW